MAGAPGAGIGTPSQHLRRIALTGSPRGNRPPGRYTLIDGHHRVARARCEGERSVPAHRVRCPEHVAFLISVRAYETYVEYWNDKLDEALSASPLGTTSRRSALRELGEPIWLVLCVYRLLRMRTTPD